MSIGKVSGMMKFEQFCQEYLQESWKSMSRLIAHAAKDPFVVIISVERNALVLGYENTDDKSKLDLDDESCIASLKEKGKKINKINTALFRSQLDNFKSGYIKVQGTYSEPVTIDDHHENVDVVENSTIVFCNEDNKNDIMRFCKHWAKTTNQDAILIIEKGRGWYYYPKTSKKESIGTFVPADVEQYFTKLVRRNDSEGGSLQRVEKRFTFTKDKTKITNALKALFDIE